MKIPLLDLKAQYQPIRSEIMAALESACDDQAFILGSRVADLEKLLLTLLAYQNQQRRRKE